MYEGESKCRSRSAQGFRVIGLLLPAIIIFYNLLINFGIVKTSYQIDHIGLIVFSFLWLAIGLLQLFMKNITKTGTKLLLLGYHLLLGSFLVFSVGFASPFIINWLILTVLSFLVAFVRGSVWSISALVVFAILDIAVHGLNSEILIIDITTLLTYVIVSIAVLTVVRTLQTNRQKYKKTKSQELLQRNRVLTIINNLADAVLSTDMSGTICIYNAACLNLLDTNNSLNGHHIDEILPLVDQDGNKVSMLKEITNAKTVTKRDDLNYFFDANDKMRLEVTFSPIRSGFTNSNSAQNHDGYVIIIRDITKAKDLEEERDEFISVVSHELRTPLTIAEGTISNVQVMMEHPDVTTSMLKDAVKTAHDQILFLAGMVNDLSTLSRAERGVLADAEDIDVRDLAHALHNKYSDEAKEKGLQLNLDISPRLGKISTSRLYLEEMLQNLITNAIKYTKKGSVTIIIRQKDGIFTFAVKDTGIGISKTDQQKVFKRFYRSEDYRTRETSGSGLGLYISAKLAQKLNTRIELTSRLNYGSTFSFTLSEAKTKQ